MKTQKLYKVTTNYGKSIISEIFTYKQTLSYEVGKTTVPVCGKIFTFATPNDVINFCSNSNLNVFEGYGTNPSKMKICSSFRDKIENFWKAIKNKKATRNVTITEETPTGTIGVDSFTPTNKYTMKQFKETFSQNS
jgi:hypothetical protein